MYESAGLIRPRRTPGGTRLYSDADLERAAAGRRELASGLGLSLQGAEYVLSLEDQVAALERPQPHARGALVEAAARASAAVDEVHRSYRRDLVLWQPPERRPSPPRALIPNLPLTTETRTPMDFTN